MTRIQLTFLALIAVQAVHSFEEYRGRLYEVFAPARMVSGLISDDLDRGFLIGNVVLVAFGSGVSCGRSGEAGGSRRSWHGSGSGSN